MSSPETTNRVVVAGLDGSGKSTSAHAAARLMSEAYPDSDIRVADSNGLFSYSAGEITRERFRSLDRLEPTDKNSKLISILKMGSFTVGRRLIEQAYATGPNLTIGVRDPHRIDPAVYMPIFLGEYRTPSVDQRLDLLNRTTRAPHPNLVAFLDSSVGQAYANAASRISVKEHETPEKMMVAAREFPNVLESYQRIYGVPSVTIPGLTPSSASQIAEAFEPFIPPKK